MIAPAVPLRRFAALLALPLIAAAPAQRDWGATLRMDAQALHDDIAANHPGPVNVEDPGFAARNDAQLRLALERAESTRSLSAYYAALRHYVASFDDGHLGLGMYGGTQDAIYWPGFLTRYGADDEQRVASIGEDAPVPLGAQLLGCDGRSAQRIAEEVLDPYFGRWSLLSQRMAVGHSLFADYGNPYIVRPARCRFEIDGIARDVTLAWRPIEAREFNRRRRAMTTQPPREIAARTLADGTRWIALGSFDSHPGSPAGRALPPLIASLRAEPAALTAAPAIVLDLRGNGGGTSDWSLQIAAILWGRSALGRLPPDNVRVDWRASAANLASLRASRDQQIAGGALSPEGRRWFDRVVDGMEAALARGAALWRETPDEGGANAAVDAGAGETARALSGPVYLITDANCASACLDAVDLWRALGAVHVGQTTSADTLYMDIRWAELPSGLGRYEVPRKVYRGRARGSNVPVVPVHRFAGDIADTPALERWIAGLPERRR